MFNMNQVAEDNVQKQCSQNNFYSKKKNKKAKDLTETIDDNNSSIVNQENLCESLKHSLHINTITNGTSDHAKESPNECHENINAQNVTVNNVKDDVNSIQCSKSYHECSNELQVDDTRTMFNEALDKLERDPSPTNSSKDEIEIVSYESELQMPEIMRLIQKDLSEPYSIYTYRYFIHNWPKLCFLATHKGKCIGAIVCKLDMHRNVVRRGYIAMLAVDENYRKRKIGSKLVEKAIQAMIDDNADEVVLETEITNKPALKLYENLGFVRDKRLFRYYLNGVDALRLKLWLR